MFVCLSVCLFVCLSVCLFVCLYVCRFVCSSVCLFFVCQFVYFLSVCQSVCLFVYLSKKYIFINQNYFKLNQTKRLLTKSLVHNTCLSGSLLSVCLLLVSVACSFCFGF